MTRRSPFLLLATLVLGLSLATVGVGHPEPAGALDAGGAAQAITAGGNVTCVTTVDGTLDCWGDNSWGQADDRTDATFTNVDTGGGHTCGLTPGNSVECWGLDDRGQTDFSPGATAVSAGTLHTCALATDGTIVCSGDNSWGQIDDQPGDFYTAISAGHFHNCALTTAATVHCWGASLLGEAEDQTSDTYTAIAAGGAHNCALTAAGTVHCWGDDSYGQATDQTSDTYTSVTAGGSHSCALTAAATIHCWGHNPDGRADDHTDTTYVAVAAGAGHTCAIRSDAIVRCWGSDNAGQLGGVPAFTSGPPPPATPGVPYLHTFGVDPTDVVRNIAVSAGTLPPGLVLDPTTGAVAGTPTTSGTYEFTITATNRFGTTDEPTLIYVSAPPGISAVSDRTIAVDTSTGPIPFAVFDDLGGAASLTVSATSSDQALLPDANLALGGIGYTRTLTATPAAGHTGTATVTITVTNLAGLSSQTSFELTVVPVAGSIDGTVTEDGSGTPLAGVPVRLYAGTTYLAQTTTAGDGTYAFADLAAGTDYRVRYLPTATHAGEFNLDAPTIHTASSVVVPSGSSTTVDAGLVPFTATAAIDGTVTDTVTTGPVGGVLVTAYRDGAAQASVRTDGFGGYRFIGLDPAGTWTIRFRDTSATYAHQWWPAAPGLLSATPVTLTAGSITTADTTITKIADLATLKGTVTEDGSGTPLAGIEVRAYTLGHTAAVTTTAGDGTWTLPGLLPGTYTVRFTDPGATHRYEFWNDSLSSAGATPIVLAATNNTTTDAALTLL